MPCSPAATADWSVPAIVHRRANRPFRLLAREGAEQGCFRVGSVFGAGRNEWDGLEPVCGRIAALKPSFEELLPRWERFRTYELPLYLWLVLKTRRSGW